MAGRLREIVECGEVAERVELAEEEFLRFHEVWDGLKWHLARRPEEGAQFDGRFYLLKSDTRLKVEGAPVVTVLYEFDDDQVRIYSLYAR